MCRFRFFCEKRRGCLRVSFVCRGGVGDFEVFYWLFYYVNLIDFNLLGGGGGVDLEIFFRYVYIN